MPQVPTQPPSLLSMATRTAMRYSYTIKDIGSIPVHLAMPFLKEIDNPQAVRDLEINSPHIAPHTERLWRRFIARDIPGWEEKIFEPESDDGWHEVYDELKATEDEERQQQEAALRQQLQSVDTKRKERGEVHFVHRVIPESSRQQMYVDGKLNPAFTAGGSKRRINVRNARNGKEVMMALRRQTQQSRQMKSLSKRWNPQTAPVPPPKSQIKEAPRSMVDAELRERGMQPHRPNEAALLRSKDLQATFAPFAPQSSGSKTIFAPRRLANKHTSKEARIDHAVRKGLEEQQQQKKATAASNTRAASTTTTRTVTAPGNASITRKTSEHPASTSAAKSPRPNRTEHHAHYAHVSAPSANVTSPSVLVKKRPPPTSVFAPTKKRKT